MRVFLLIYFSQLDILCRQNILEALIEGLSSQYLYTSLNSNLATVLFDFIKNILTTAVSHSTKKCIFTVVAYV